MKQGKNLKEDFCIWLHEDLTNFLGNNPEKTDYLLFPVKELTKITIEEVYWSLQQRQWPSPQKNTAAILEIDRKTVQRKLDADSYVSYNINNLTNMSYGKNLSIDYRIWLREKLTKFLGDNPENTDYLLFPVKELRTIIIEEVHLYIQQQKWRSPQKTTAAILEIDRKTAQRALK